MKNNTIINIAAIAAGLYLISKALKKPAISTTEPLKYGTSGTMNTGFSNLIGNFANPFKKKKGSAQRATKTRCATNLERLAMLNPNDDQYNAELGKAYRREGSNFNNWAQAQSNPCFVVGAEQGGLQSGGINFDGSVTKDGAFNKSYFNAHGDERMDGDMRVFNTVGAGMF